MVDFVYMKNSETEGTQWFPDLPGVKERFEAVGWAETDPPADKPFISEHLDVVEGTGAWVRLYHPEVDAYHDYPNNAAALEGAYEAGWRIPSDDSEKASKGESSETSPKSETPKKISKSSTSAKADTKEKE